MRLRTITRAAAVLAFLCGTGMGTLPANAAGIQPGTASRPELVSDLKQLLHALGTASSNLFFQNHCEAIISVLDSTSGFLTADSLLLQGMYNSFSEPSGPSSAALLSSYLERKRPFILSWISPADGRLSLAWLIPPQDWNPDLQYPLTVRLHGLSEEAYGTRIRYLTRYLVPGTVLEASFEGGYTLLPWGRGNLWYHNMGDADVRESIDVLKSMVHVDPDRQYLVGMSMGGYGAWKLAVETPEIWAGVGVFAGALQYDGNRLLTLQAATILKDVPVYIVCGTSDGLLSTNQMAYQLLEMAGNTEIVFTTFDGGHVAPLPQWSDMYAWIRNFSNEAPQGVQAESSSAPESPVLMGNYPNPFNPETRLRYAISGPGEVEFRIYSADGGLVRSLSDRALSAGWFDERWDGKDDSGHPVASGIYICRIAGGSPNGRSVAPLKMCLIR
jgi:predicted esterase